MKTFSARRLAALLVLGLGLGAATASAATDTWTGGGATNVWTDTGNWGGATLATGDTLIFSGSGGSFPISSNSTTAGNKYAFSFSSGAAAFTLGGNLVGVGTAGALTNDSSSTQTLNMNLKTDAAWTLNLNAGSVALNGILASGSVSFGVNINGPGTLFLNGANTLTSTTTLNSGTLVLGNNAAFGTGTFHFYGGALQAASATTITNAVVGGTAQNSTVTVSGANDITFAGNYVVGNTLIVLANNLDAGKSLVLSGGVQLSSSPTSRALTVAGSGTTTVSGAIINGSASSGSVAYQGTGKMVLSNAANTYTGTTTVTSGTMVVNGSIASSSGVTVASTGTLGGTGTVSAITAQGRIAPGDGGAGILTASSLTFSGSNTAFSFEMNQAGNAIWGNAAASGNDVLHLEGATPLTFTASGSAFDVYFSGAGTFTGGFFTTATSDFLSKVSNGDYTYYVLDAHGAFSYDGNIYSLLDSSDVTMTTAQIASAAFADGTVANGWSQQFTVSAVPEPPVWAALGLAAGLGIAFRRRLLPS